MRILFRDQLKRDRFNEFQRPYVLDAAVVGVGVGKTFWRNEARPSKRKVLRDARSHDPDKYGSSPVPIRCWWRRTTSAPCSTAPTEAVDLRDLYWHEAAVSVEKSRFFGHAVWNSYDDL
jgi:hypothetical protein